MCSTSSAKASEYSSARRRTSSTTGVMFANPPPPANFNLSYRSQALFHTSTRQALNFAIFIYCQHIYCNIFSIDIARLYITCRTNKKGYYLQPSVSQHRLKSIFRSTTIGGQGEEHPERCIYFLLTIKNSNHEKELYRCGNVLYDGCARIGLPDRLLGAERSSKAA